MSTWYFEVYYGTGAGAAWTDVGANNLAFTGDGGHDDTVEVGEWQGGTHVVSGTPGNDVCTDPHAPNVKYVDATHFDSGGGVEDLNDANLLATEVSCRLHFSHGSAVSLKDMAIFAYDGTTETTPAPDCEIQIFERGILATEWTELNDDSDGVGGSGDAFAIQDQPGAATDLYVYLAISWHPETVGPKVGSRLKIQGKVIAPYWSNPIVTIPLNSGEAQRWATASQVERRA